MVHPRVCGEARVRVGHVNADRGPSPRVRGSPVEREPARGARGSIPACAGKPRSRRRCHRSRGVHPRVCGEARLTRQARSWRQGPSPRVRGSRGGSPGSFRSMGSIPACAGKPSRRASAPSRPRVHPRVCGEANVDTDVEGHLRGPSPRVRGSPQLHQGLEGRKGSIPACAGKPAAFSASSTTTWVHPRVCGEAPDQVRLVSALTGPSPRVRGSPAAKRAGLMGRGSIPACAGKPAWSPPMM